MSWAEEQPWFGRENQAMEALIEQEENGYYVVLIDYKGHKEYFIDYPFYNKSEAIEEALAYKGKCKFAKIYKGRQTYFDLKD